MSSYGFRIGVPALLAAVIALPTVGVPAFAGTGNHGYLDARVRLQNIEGGLTRTVDQLQAARSEPQWVEWTVPAVHPGQAICCFDDWSARDARGTCDLESRNNHMGHYDDAGQSGGDVRVLLRLAAGTIDTVRAYSSRCQLNAGGRLVTLLQGVEPKESVDFLTALVLAERGRKLSDETVMAIANHADAAADAALGGFAHRDSPRRLRERSAFWLGASRGQDGLTVLRRMLRQERDAQVLDQIVFGISLSRGAGTGELLIDTARNDERTEVRKKALFWLAQRAGERVVETLGEAVDDDPEAEVREHAVFALSQLSGGRGVPMLIQLARNNRHPEVRRRAMFWLGQSGDARALELFEEILTE